MKSILCSLRKPGIFGKETHTNRECVVHNLPVACSFSSTDDDFECVGRMFVKVRVLSLGPPFIEEDGDICAIERL